MAELKSKNAYSVIEYGFLFALVAVIFVTVVGRFAVFTSQHGLSANRYNAKAEHNLTLDELEKRCNQIGSTYSSVDGKCQ